MALGIPLFESEAPASQAVWYRRALGVLALTLWVTTLVFFARHTTANPSGANLAVLTVLFTLFTAVQAQVLLVRWSGMRAFRRLRNRMHGSVYISDVAGLPNRNYLLAELRREMPRARDTRKPFVVVIVSIDGYDQLQERRGEEFTAKLLAETGNTLQQVTRRSDFVAYLGGPDFGVLLTECSLEQSYKYYNRIPMDVTVDHRRQPVSVTLGIRAAEYDMESIYATDVLRESEKAPFIRQGTRQRIARAG